MKKYLTVIIVIILSTSFLGCLNGPSPPGVDLPELIVHHAEDKENETIINLRAMELVLFNEITLYLNDTETNESEKVMWNNSFGSEHTTELSNFNLSIFVRREEKRYHFNATFELYPDEDLPVNEYDEEKLIYRIKYYDGEEKYITMDDLPIIEPLNPMED